jgi:2-polyprenyl-6-methoxyphenol hydroxylase-like FAD-dependent oxidoreductase
MIVDGHEGLDGSEREVCVVGAGPLGISLAIRLAELGVSVLLMESGASRAIIRSKLE